MKNSGIRWKELSDSKTQRNIHQTFPEKSKTKSKKYNPTRSPTASHLHIKMKSINKNKDIENNNHQHLDIPNISIIENGEISPSKTDQSFFKIIKKRQTTMRTSTIQPNQLILIKKLLEHCQNQNPKQNISSNQNQTNNKNHILFSELTQIKNDFIKFKQIVQSELCKQNQYIKQTIKTIQQQIQQNINKHNNLQQKQYINHISQNYKNINKIDEICTKNTQYFNNILKDYNLQLDQSIKNTTTSNHKHKHQRIKSDISSLQTHSKENCPVKSMTVKNLEMNNKKQFEKLFQAVDCLKRDMKDWNGLTSPKQQTPKIKNNFLKPERTTGKCTQFITLRKSSFLINKSKIQFI